MGEWVKIADLKSTVAGPQGATGPQGIPGVNAVANDAATAGYITTAGTSDTKTALLSNYMPAAAAVIPGLVTLAQAVTAAVAKGGGEVSVPAGTHQITANLTIPLNVRLVGAGIGVTFITGSTTGLRIEVGSTSASWGGVAIRDLSMNGVGLTVGPSASVLGYGQIIERVAIYNCSTYGLICRWGVFNTTFREVRLFSNTLGGVYHDNTDVDATFPTAGVGSAMVYDKCSIFNNLGPAITIDGWIDDGYNVTMSGCNLEHNTTSVKIFNVDATQNNVLTLLNCHFELNTTTYIEADSGFVIIEGGWMGPLQATAPQAFFKLSGTSKVDVGRMWLGRVPAQNADLTGSARLTVRPSDGSGVWGTQVTSTSRAITPITAASTRGVYLPSGYVTGKHIDAAIAMAHSTAVTVAQFMNGDANPYEISYTVDLAGMGASNNLITTCDPVTGGTNASMVIPTAATWAQVRVVWQLNEAHITAVFSDGSTQKARLTLTHTLISFRDLKATIGGAGTATGTLRNVIAQVL